jgi:membrane complex biogenesis BtpA family protein
MARFMRGIFETDKPIIGMLHVPALPGSPANKFSLHRITDSVLKDADALADGGIDGFIIENFGDVPFYPGTVPPHTVAFLTAIAQEVRRGFERLPLGINILRNDAKSGLAIASAVGARFIRVNIHAGARLTDQGLIEGAAYETLRYRKLLGSNVMIFADAAVKHSTPLAPRDLADEVEELVSRACADAIVITGRATGRQTAVDHLKIAKAAAGSAPVLAGSGVEISDVANVLSIADGLIVGTTFKVDGVTANPVDLERVRRFMATAGRR